MNNSSDRLTDDKALVRDVQTALGGASQTAAAAVLAASKPLWDALEDLALVDGYDGGEYRSLFPDVLRMLLDTVNNLCRCGTKQRKGCPDLLHQSQQAQSMHRTFVRERAGLAPARVLLDEKHALGLLTDEEFQEQECELLRFHVRLEARQVFPPTS